MDIQKIINDVIQYAESNPIIVALIAVAVLYLLIKKPKILFGLIVIGLLYGAVMKILARLFETSKF